MASVKIIMRKEEKADGTYPLAIRITKDRKSSYIYFEYSIKPSDWDEKLQRVKKSHPNSVRLNNFLIKKLSEAINQALDVETNKEQISARAVRNKIKPSTGATFFPQAQEYLDHLKQAGKYNQYTPAKSRIDHFKEFLKNEDVAFSDLTVSLLERFTLYLKSTYKPKNKRYGEKKRISERSIVNHLVVIRSVFAHARKNGIVTRAQSPFGEDGIKIKFPDTKKSGITQEDLEALENLELTDEKHEHARKVWLFSFYLAGMRVSNVFRLKWSDFQNYRLHYSMGKNSKADSLKVPDKAVAILKHYEQFKRNKDDLVFPDLKDTDLDNGFITQRTISYKTSAIDKILRKHVAPAAGIESHLTMHISRHTFGEIAGDAIPVQMLQKLYRHSNVSTTIGYQNNFINKAADDALDAVINKPKPKLSK